VDFWEVSPMLNVSFSSCGWIRSVSVCLVAIFLFIVLSANEVEAARQQIFAQGGAGSSNRLGAEGQCAYIVSSQGQNRGILLSKVNGNGLASNAGMTEGDVLLNVNGHVIASFPDADRVLSDLASGVVKFTYARQGDTGLLLYSPSVRYTNPNPAPSRNNSIAHSSMPSPERSGKDRTASYESMIPQLEGYMVQLINADRSKYGLGSVGVSSSIAGVARDYAKDMAARGFRGHVDPEGRDPTARGRAAGLNFQLGENLGWFNGMSPEVEVKKIHEIMMSEPPDDPNNHRGNILNHRYGSIGVGIAFNPKTGEMNLVEDFAL
jgi:uncharacterized protein YkwD